MANTNKLIETLVETRINGNSISGNKTYENMLKRITKDNIDTYAYELGYAVCTGSTKLGMIEAIRDNIDIESRR